MSARPTIPRHEIGLALGRRQHFKAYRPYLLALVVGLLLLILFPGITLFLPRQAGVIR